MVAAECQQLRLLIFRSHHIMLCSGGFVWDFLILRMGFSLVTIPINIFSRYGVKMPSGSSFHCCENSYSWVFLVGLLPRVQKRHLVQISKSRRC